MRMSLFSGIAVPFALYLALLPAAGGLADSVTPTNGPGSPLHQAMHVIGIVHIHSVGGYVYVGPQGARWEASPSAEVHHGAGGPDLLCPLDLPSQFELAVLAALPSAVRPSSPAVFFPQAERPPPA